jgi:uncharacterized protein YdaU (DUF1376 family)
MNRPPAFLFYPDKWCSHTERLSDSSYRVYHKLLCWMWQSSKDQCSVTASPEAVSVAVAKPLPVVEEAMIEIMNKEDPLLKREGKRWVSNGLRKALTKLEDRSAKQRDKAHKRWAVQEQEQAAAPSTPEPRTALDIPLEESPEPERKPVAVEKKPRIEIKSDRDIFDTARDPVDLASALTGDWSDKGRSGWRRLLNIIGSDRFRSQLATTWSENKQGERADNPAAALTAKLKKMAEMRMGKK